MADINFRSEIKIPNGFEYGASVYARDRVVARLARFAAKYFNRGWLGK